MSIRKYNVYEKLKYRFLKQSLLSSFQKWKKREKNGSFSDFYVEMEWKKVRTGAQHQSLGINLGEGVFEEAGLEAFNKLLKWGLKPHHHCVDYGCGSLRIGQHLISYLNPNCYWGLDVTDQFYQLGVEKIPTEKLAEKKPQFYKINAETLTQAAENEIDYVWCSGVLIHIPPFELKDFLTQILTLLGPNTAIFIDMAAYQENAQISPLSWAYTKDYLRDELYSCNASLSVSFLDFHPFQKHTVHGVITIERGFICISKKNRK